MYKIGTKVKVASDNDNENYNSFRDKVLRITHISKNTKDHPGYDEGLSPMLLFDLETEEGEEVPFSLYEYEIELV